MDGDVGISLTDGIVEFSRKDVSRSFAVQERNLLVLVAVRFQVFDLVGEFREVLENLLYLQSGETTASCYDSNLFIHLLKMSVKFMNKIIMKYISFSFLKPPASPESLLR